MRNFIVLSAAKRLLRISTHDIEEKDGRLFSFQEGKHPEAKMKKGLSRFM